MSVFKRYKGERINSKHPRYADARWWVYKRIKGHKTLHKAIPEARTKEQAEAAERKLVDDIFNRKFGVADTTTTFAGFVDGVYWRYVEQHNANIKAKRYECGLLKKFFKKKPLSSITPQDCRDLQWSLAQTKNQKYPARKLSPSSVNRITTTASKIFSLACEEGILDRNPMQYVRSLKEPPPRKRLLTDEEKERLWTELEKDLLMLRFVTLAVNLPLRRGQLTAITPDALDLPRSLLFTISSKGRVARSVPLNNIATLTLQAMLADGQIPFPVLDFRKRWNRALIAAGINKEGGTREENFHFHDLRKEFASELIRRNVNPAVVQRLFAHSDMSITDVYLDADAATLFDAVKRLDDNIQNSEVIQ